MSHPNPTDGGAPGRGDSAVRDPEIAVHEAEPDQPGAEEHSAAGRSPVGPLLVGVVMLALGVLMLTQTFHIKGGGFEPSGPRFMPFVVASLWTVLALIYLGQQVSRLVRRADNLPAERFTHMLGAATLVVLLVIYAYLLDPLGYVIATSLFFLGASRAMGSRQWFRDLIVAVALSLLVYLTFTRALGVHLPEGVLGL